MEELSSEPPSPSPEPDDLLGRFEMRSEGPESVGTAVSSESETGEATTVDREPPEDGALEPEPPDPPLDPPEDGALEPEPPDPVPADPLPASGSVVPARLDVGALERTEVCEEAELSPESLSGLGVWPPERSGEPESDVEGFFEAGLDAPPPQPQSVIADAVPPPSGSPSERPTAAMTALRWRSDRA